MHSDPVADMLTRIRNASRARLQRLALPTSKLKVRIAEILKREGYIEDYREMSGQTHSELEIKLRYDERREPLIGNIKRWSSPGLRVYFGCEDIPRIQNGLGILILTTSKGLMTDREARKARIGGEALCSVW
jgi:small subunit ribosomal protein S8